MNSYNENLHASVVASLTTQELQEMATRSDANASMFSLYYAEGATITAGDNLNKAKANQSFTEEVKAQAVDNSNICNNLLASATQANQYIQTSTNNAAVCAANVQIAANSVLRLAGDMGSIYSIIHAADADTELDNLAKNALNYISTTAYAAEKASQLAMEVSIKTAEVTSAIVLNKAQNTTSAMNGVLQIATNNFNTAVQTVTTANAAFAQANANEKLAEGDYKDKSIDFISTKSAYGATNKKLNQDLKAHAKNQNTFTFSFDLLTSPFAPNETEPNYPVSNYYAFVVPETEKTTFSITNAENILLMQPNRVIPVTFLKEASTVSHITIQGLTTYDLTTNNDGIQTVKMDVNYTEANILDVDGKKIVTGTNYVIFILAVYYPDYKKAVNCYDDFLTAPSWPFCMTNKLVAVNPENIQVPLVELTGKHQKQTKPDENKHKDDSYALYFNVAENPNFAESVEYRCIFLPKSTSQNSDLLNSASFKAFEEEVESLEKIADEFDPKIAKLQSQIIQATADMAIISPPDADQKQSGKTAKNSKKQPEKKQTPKAMPTTDIDKLQKELDVLIGQKNDAINAIKTGSTSNIDFIFNKTIAEQVLAGNYTVAKPALLAPSSPTGSAKNSGKNTGSEDNNGYPVTYWTVPVQAATTDNFGNLLMGGATYLPVILSVAVTSEENIPMFTNAWSGNENAPDFVYQQQPGI
ncbi:MAG TPA: hypothetical protein VD905_07895 [Flavobacteriales bacterium]|nr:hypothetical protein [Flavobacteriales bacterium]